MNVEMVFTVPAVRQNAGLYEFIQVMCRRVPVPTDPIRKVCGGNYRIGKQRVKQVGRITGAKNPFQLPFFEGICLNDAQNGTCSNPHAGKTAFFQHDFAFVLEFSTKNSTHSPYIARNMASSWVIG